MSLILDTFTGSPTDREDTRMHASFNEKSAWVTMIGLVIAGSAYFFVAGQMLAAGVTEVAPYVPVMILSTVVLVLLLVAGHVVAAIGGGADEQSDERDRLIAWRAEHHTSWLLAVVVLTAVFGLLLPVGRAWVANGLLAGLFLAEIANHATQLVLYRRGV